MMQVERHHLCLMHADNTTPVPRENLAGVRPELSIVVPEDMRMNDLERSGI